MKKKTKIVCTLGPASRDPEIIEEMLKAGMNVARLNFSHGSYDEHRKAIESFRSVRDKLGVPAAVMLDTKGPEIRLGDFARGSEFLQDGAGLTLTTEECAGTAEKVQITYKELPAQVTVGNVIRLDDGRIELEVESVTDKEINCRVTAGGEISSKKGVNVPDVSLDLEYVSERDKSDLLFGIEMDVDYVAASFVRTADDVKQIRMLLNENGGEKIKIISKIENMQGINNFGEILELSDGIMVARGDMGVEVDYEKLPGLQKRFIRACCIAGKPVITATQMLESMTSNPAPTRAEITDVANAVFDGTSAVMLSGESAMGKYPVETVKAMSRIIMQAELDLRDVDPDKGLEFVSDHEDVSNAIGHAACTTARDIKSSAIVAVTMSGYTAQMMAKYRPEVPVVAVTPDRKTYHQQALVFGVCPLLTDIADELEEIIEDTKKQLRNMELVAEGDSIVYSAGMPLKLPGTTNLIRVTYC